MRNVYYIRFVLPTVFYVLVGMISEVRGQEVAWKDLLSRTHDLSPNYEVGDKDFYHMKTVYLEMSDSGTVANTSVLDGYFVREVTRIEKGKRFDRFVWKMVKRGGRPGRGEIRDYSVMDFTKNFQYELSIEDWTPEHLPFDLSSIPKTMEGWTFVVKLMDAHTFDVVLRLDDYQGTLACIGDTAVLPAEGVPVVMDFPPLFTDTHFTNAPFYTNFLGLTLYHGEPCAILSFRSDDCRVRLVVNMMDMKLPTDGVSYYFGEVFISLQTGRIQWGQIIERVDSITTAFVQAGTPMRQVTRREITLERMNRRAYEDLDLK